MTLLAEYVIGVVMTLLALALLIGIFACMYYSVKSIFRAWQEIKRQELLEAAVWVVASALLIFAAFVCFVFTGYAVSWGMEVMP